MASRRRRRGDEEEKDAFDDDNYDSDDDAKPVKGKGKGKGKSKQDDDAEASPEELAVQRKTAVPRDDRYFLHDDRKDENGEDTAEEKKEDNYRGRQKVNDKPKELEGRDGKW